MGKLPLEGIRIADFTQVVQGPYATMLMGQMGAEVIKVETESRTAMDQRMGRGFHQPQRKQEEHHNQPQRPQGSRRSQASGEGEPCGYGELRNRRYGAVWAGLR